MDDFSYDFLRNSHPSQHLRSSSADPRSRRNHGGYSGSRNRRGRGFAQGFPQSARGRRTVSHTIPQLSVSTSGLNSQFNRSVNIRQQQPRTNPRSRSVTPTVQQHPASSKQKSSPQHKTGAKRNDDGRPRSIGYKKLENMLQKFNPNDIVLSLSMDCAELDELLSSDLGNGMIQMLLKVCGKMSQTTEMREQTTKVLNILVKHQFLPKAYKFIRGFLKESSREEDNRILHIQNCLCLMTNLLTVLPASMEEEVEIGLDILDNVIDKLGLSAVKEGEYYKEVKGQLKHIEERRKVKVERATRKREKPSDEAHLLPPPDDFRFIPVIPRPEDLREDADPFIRSNLIGGAYQDMDHYLDVQYRLLREDYIRPLRDGIAQISGEDSVRGNGRNSGRHNVKVYTDVMIEFMKPTRKGILHRLHFSTETLQGIRWRNTKRLLQGNLLCLSYDNFQNHMIFAVVADRNPADLEQGHLWVEFVQEIEKHDDSLDTGPDMETEVLQNVDYHLAHTMVESEAYFEAYKHVLGAMKEMRSIPLERYIVKCSNDVQAPEYLRPSVAGTNVSYGIKVKGGIANVKVLGQNWPTAEQISLDGTQTEALKLALTKELAIIQGPPGTGKTHVGLEIMRILLENKTKWSQSRSQRSTGISSLKSPAQQLTNSPILVVCYTNHALDQFVEGITKLSDGKTKIVRVGGRCANESIKKYSLATARDQKRKKNKKGRGVKGAAIGKVFWRMRTIEEEYQDSVNMLEYSLRVVLDLKLLEKANNGNLLKQLRPYSNHGLLNWLGVDTVPTENENLNCQSDSTELGSYDGKIEEIDVTEEADYEQDRRLLEEDYDDEQYESEMMKKKRLEESFEGSAKFEHLQAFIPQTDNQGFQLPKRVIMKSIQKLKRAQNNTSVMTDAEVRRIKNIYQLNLHDKWRLYRTWTSRWRDSFRETSGGGLEEYKALLRELKDLRDCDDGEILKEADIVALTTTGAAKYRNMIQKLNCKIVVIEEAAEVLEAHIVTTMPKATNHLILIGDHQQLRPSPTVYDLAKKFNLDTSLFERLVKTNLPYVTLSLQHRMRPSIADLIRPDIYKIFRDHESVMGRDRINGVDKSLYFVSHQIPEESVQDGKSKKNLHEAKFLSKLCEYLLLQGYKPEQITILTMYTGQLLAFRNFMSSKCRGVRVTAVDNFQGEENDIILMSLVRSNFEGKIGFLSIDNRICVALSRARNALYCIGNMTLLQSKSALWSSIVTKLSKADNIGEGLKLQCQNHPERFTMIYTSEDFQQVAEGGCSLPCVHQLPCGHVCSRQCHPDDHSKTKCMKKCSKEICVLGHKCKKKCWEECGDCIEKIFKNLPCGHSAKAVCYLPPERIICHTPITESLACGHDINTECHLAGTKTVEDCTEKCYTYLPCGHLCGGTCSRCFQGRLHMPCKEKCKSKLWCGHKCNTACSPYCQPCNKKCTTYCDHTICQLKCSDPCIPCKEYCTWKCGHYKCSKECGELCDRPRCDEPCKKKLKCGHPCIGLCGEKCIDICKECNMKEYEELLTKLGVDDRSRFIQLEKCGHIFDVYYLDEFMDSFDDEFQIKQKKCPTCSKEISWNKRYGNVLKRISRKINAVKNKVKNFGMVEQADVEILKSNAKDQLQKIGAAFPHLQSQLRGILRNLEPTNNKVAAFQQQMNNLTILSALKVFLSKIAVNKVTTMHIEIVGYEMRKIADWIAIPRASWSSDESTNLKNELKRMELSVRLLNNLGKMKEDTFSNKPSITEAIRKAKTYLFQNIQSLTDTKRKWIDDVIKVLNQYLKISEDKLLEEIQQKETDMLKPKESHVHEEWFLTPTGEVSHTL